MLKIGNPPSISIYLHIPFCTKKCPYCHFYVLPDQERFKKQLLEGLKLEIKRSLSKIIGKEIVSIYFGGGTPTLFAIDSLSQILAELLPYSTAATEISIEANPQEITHELIHNLLQIGFNRLSIGIQSFDDPLLKTLGRMHSADKAIFAIETAASAGMQNISIDLMYELPTQTLKSWEETLKIATGLPITHLSLYNLTFEPNTPFYRKKETYNKLLPTPEAATEMLITACNTFEKNNFHRYEISAFCKDTSYSRHNHGYWTARPFLGFGPSAFSYWEGKRFRNSCNLQSYCQALLKDQSPTDFEEQLPYPRNLHELLAVQLRLTEGVDLAAFEALHGQIPPQTLICISQLQERGWLARDGARLRLTEEGKLFYDSVAEAII